MVIAPEGVLFHTHHVRARFHANILAYISREKDQNLELLNRRLSSNNGIRPINSSGKTPTGGQANPKQSVGSNNNNQVGILFSIRFVIV
jgi:hypothetical protein